MAKGARLTVVVPSYGSRRTLERCLSALLREARRLPCEIIVVDSGADGVQELVRERFPEVRLLALSERALPGRARNLGAAAAVSGQLAFVDADCVVEPGWGERVRRSLDAGRGFTGGAVLPSLPRSLLGVVGTLAEFAAFLPGPSRAAAFAPSCNLLVERARFDAAGGFPEDMRSGEDLIFCARCRALGDAQALHFDGARGVRHEQHESWRGLLGHLVDVGRGSAQARAREPSLAGAFSAGRPALLPLIVGWRLVRIAQHAGRAQRSGWLLAAVVLSPFLLVCLCAWACGFCAPASFTSASR